MPGYWGRKGSTFVWYEKADAALVTTLLRMSWTNVAPAKLRRDEQNAAPSGTRPRFAR